MTDRGAAKSKQRRAAMAANGGSATGRTQPEAAARQAPLVGARPGTPWWWAVLLPLLGCALFVGAVLGYDGARSAQYSSETFVAVLPDDPTAEVSATMTSIWVEVGNSDLVLDQVADALGTSRSDLDAALTVAQSADAPLVSIRARTDDADRSAAWANAAAAALVAESEAERLPGWTLEQVTPARPARSEEPFATTLLIGSAAGLGLLAGAALAQVVLRRHRRHKRATA